MDFDSIPLDAYFFSPGHILGAVLYQKTNGDDGYRYWTKEYYWGMSDDTFPEFENVVFIDEADALKVIASLQPTAKSLDGVPCIGPLHQRIKKRH